MKFNYLIVIMLFFANRLCFTMDYNRLFEQSYPHIQRQKDKETIILISEDYQRFPITEKVAIQSKKFKDEISAMSKTWHTTAKDKKIIQVPLKRNQVQEIVNLLYSLKKYQNLNQVDLLNKLQSSVKVSNQALREISGYLDLPIFSELADQIDRKKEK